MKIRPSETWSLDTDFEGKATWVRDARWGGAFQVSWEDLVGVPSVRFEISNDGETWQAWTALSATDSSATVDVPLTGSNGNHMWEITRWTARYFRVVSLAGSATSGTASLVYTINKA